MGNALKVTLIKIAVILLQLVYIPIKIFVKPRRKVTFISRQSNHVSYEFNYYAEKINFIDSSVSIKKMAQKIEGGIWNKLLYIFHMFKQMYHISSSKVLILDGYCITASVLSHRTDLKIIQTWHALGLMKQMGFNILNKEEGSDQRIAEAMKMHKNYDYIFVSAEACRQPIANSMRYPVESTVVSPLPRVDILRDAEYISSINEKVKKDYPKLRDKITLLYAPTFRKDEEELQEKLNVLIDCIDLNVYNIVVKPHPLSKLEVSSSDVIIDNNYSTLDMMMACDVVITDYSSLIYEAAILKKKIYFFCFDLHDYDYKRGFFIDFINEVPGNKNLHPEEVIASINAKTYDPRKMQKFLNKYVDLSKDEWTEWEARFMIEQL